MCGIAGLLCQADTLLPESESHSRVSQMQARLIHRGPDDQGVYVSPSGQAALAHTRLSIIDLSAAGHQPMSTADGRYTIVYNGEIYNHKKLRNRLEEKGIELKSQSDTEILLQLYVHEGPRCINLLRGMFAFLIWDDKAKLAFAARDPFGIKPLYYCARDGQLAVASEMRALLESKLSRRRLSARGIKQYLLRGSFSEPDTSITDIKMLPAGTTLVWQRDKPRLQRYWRPQFDAQSMDRSHAVEVCKLAFEHSVRAHLVSDVPVGLFLSGGIDSAAILSVASKLTKKPINTYSIAFEDPEFNEGDLAKRLAKKYGANHRELLMTPELARTWFHDFIQAVDQATIDGFNTYCVARFAAQHGEKVVLSGLGGDELFGSYPSFTRLPKLMSNAQRLGPVGPMIGKLGELISKQVPAKARRAIDTLKNANSLPAIHQSFRGIFSNYEADQLTALVAGKTADANLTTPRAQDMADQISELELSTYMRNQLLRDSDVFSMVHGLELRVPFVDKVLFEQLAAIPANIRLEQGKRLLTDAVGDLPKWLINRPKQGFRFPFDAWLEQEWQALPTSSVPRWIKLQPWYRYWSVSVLQDWLKRHA